MAIKEPSAARGSLRSWWSSLGARKRLFSCDFCHSKVQFPTLYLHSGVPCYFCEPGCLKGYAKKTEADRVSHLLGY